MRFLVLLSLLLTTVITPALSESIPGMPLEMEPPPGFVSSSQYPGFQKDDEEAFIMVVSLPVSAEKLIASFTKEKLATRGMTLQSQETVEGGELFLIEQPNPANGVLVEKLVYIMGGGDSAYIITGGYPKDIRDSNYDSMKTALLTSSIATEEVDPLEGLTFGWTSGPTFKPQQRVLNGLLFTPNGDPPPQTTFMVVAPSVSRVESVDSESLAKEILLSEKGFENIKITSVENLEVDGLPATELIAEANDGTEDVKIYHLLLLNVEQESYIRAFGSAPKAEFESVVDELRNLGRSLTYK